jgi:hypothetical protein
MVGVSQCHIYGVPYGVLLMWETMLQGDTEKDNKMIKIKQINA